MSMEAVLSFWKALEHDSALQQKVDPQGTGIDLRTTRVVDMVTGIARSAGYDVHPDELRAAESVQQFWMRVDRDPDLQRQIMPAGELSRADAINLIHKVAQKSGFMFTADQLKVVSAARPQSAGSDKGDLVEAEAGAELNEAELASVAGGALNAYYYYRAPTAYYYYYASLGSNVLGAVAGL
jgi:hypothetical protein